MREARPLLEVGRIFHEPAVTEYARGQEILARFPDAERIEVPSHWNIGGLHENEGLVNFSPVIVYEGWCAEYGELFSQIDDALSSRAKKQLACEVIFLTHNEALHEVNLGWHPKAEDLLWTPDLQEKKVSENGAANVRYARGKKGKMVKLFGNLLAEHLPYCTVRYAF